MATKGASPKAAGSKAAGGNKKTPAKTVAIGRSLGKKKVSFAFIHKLTAGVSLIAFAVIMLAGIRAEARLITLVYRAAAVIFIIGIISRILIRILATYEEMNSGKA